MQIPIMSGIYADSNSDLRTAYPLNYVPIPKQSGVSAGYLRPAEGIVEFGEGPGFDYGGINWDGVMYRVMGTKLVSIASDGTDTVLGDVAAIAQVSLTYSFDNLAIASRGNLYLYDGATLTQVTDPDIGTVLDVIWVDGYFMTTDGEFLVVTELNDPTNVNPLKYGSSEADPDPVKKLLKLRNDPVALNRYTIETFENIGGTGFPFQRIEGAQIMRGTVGTHTACIYMDAIAFLGGARNEDIGVYIGANGNSQKVSTREIDQVLGTYTEAQLSLAIVEARSEASRELLYIHLSDKTFVFDGGASKEVEQPVWSILSSGLESVGAYRARNFVRCYDKWIAGDPTTFKLGYLTNSVSTHYGSAVGWEFQTQIIYNESRGAVFHELELVSITGNVALGANPTVWTSYSTDGVTYSQEKACSAGTIGQRSKRIAWFQQGLMRDRRIQKFRGTSAAHISVARLEARLEPLNV